jgi:hypothetical protein
MLLFKKNAMCVSCPGWFAECTTAIPDEDGGDQSSIAQTSRPEITQSQIEGLYFPNSL